MFFNYYTGKCCIIALICLAMENLRDSLKYLYLDIWKLKIQADDGSGSCDSGAPYSVGCRTKPAPGGAGAGMQALNHDALNKRAFATTMKLWFPPCSAQLYCRTVIILMFKAKCLSLVLNCRNFQSP